MVDVSPVSPEHREIEGKTCVHNTPPHQGELWCRGSSRASHAKDLIRSRAVASGFSPMALTSSVIVTSLYLLECSKALDHTFLTHHHSPEIYTETLNL